METSSAGIARKIRIAVFQRIQVLARVSQRIECAACRGCLRDADGGEIIIAQNGESLDLRLERTVFRMEMRRRMISIVHRDHDPEETGNLRHSSR